jgi:hypothetical protein
LEKRRKKASVESREIFFIKKVIKIQKQKQKQKQIQKQKQKQKQNPCKFVKSVIPKTKSVQIGIQLQRYLFFNNRCLFGTTGIILFCTFAT